MSTRDSDPSGVPVRPIPLDLERTGYSYVERHNTTLVSLLDKHVLRYRPRARVLDVGCGAGANGRAIRAKAPSVELHGIEPDEGAANLARDAYDAVFHGDVNAWLKGAGDPPFDAVVLSDVLEHIVDPIAFLRSLAKAPSLSRATWVISVPNYGVWYNRMNALLGRFEYAWSGLYDRTHVRFFTRASIRRALAYAGLRLVDESCTPSLVQSLAPVLRKFFERDVAKGEHLTLTASPAYRIYTRAVEPTEAALCRAWPELLGFQIVTVARLS
jgi:trans-aconitate methyltransferase